VRIAIVGYGKMGQAIEQIALKNGHVISSNITINNLEDIKSINTGNTDVAIEFSTPDSAFKNISTLLNNGVKVISGTTGWLDQKEEIELLCNDLEGTFLYASNFSLGVNLFYKLNEELARLMKNHKYEVSITETHHIHKLDKPSGTALSLARGIGTTGIQIESIRENEVPGTHTVNYKNDIDQISITHEAKSRDGFAIGAVSVAEWITHRTGVLTMKDFLNL